MSELSADSRPDTQRVEVGMGAFARDFGRGAALYMESCIRCGNCAEACQFHQIDATGAEVTLTSCANCRQTFDDGQAHYHWDRRMGSLLEVVADRLEPAPLTSPTSY